MLPTNLRSIWRRGFRGEFFLEIDQPETWTAYGGHISCPISTEYRKFVQDLAYIIPTK